MLDKYTPQQIETVRQLAEEGKLKEVTEIVKQALINNNLLVVVLEEENSVPKVFYKGKEIKHKLSVLLDWETDTDTYGGLSYSIEHADLSKGYSVTNRIDRKVKGHASN
ncbi:hypothetical protein [Paraliobacillus sp. X-1268]|uniref:hypothetical protein n=1 Tax=Paraliobacillus sp. X-1268 TaxID=2213193 RepID=UPI000E3DD81A|nr:hypothetical protein [Paraliobacillus sp. X-1268]